MKRLIDIINTDNEPNILNDMVFGSGGVKRNNMKNIHLIPTDKPSRLIFDKEDKTFLPLQNEPIFMEHQDLVENQHIYITNDEEIKEGDWYLTFLNKEVIGKPRKCEDSNWNFSSCKKIIITTDQDLIKDGVQSIDDTFLKWFVENPSCEFVKVNVFPKFNLNDRGNYKIIIPQEEPKQFSMNADLYENHSIVLPELPKQEKERGITITHVGKKETLKEVAERLYSEDIMWGMDLNKDTKNAFIQGAKWQQEKMYSEEEVEQIFNIGQMIKNYGDYKPLTFKEALEQFKKK
jgi:hypothetical protein